jgi:hypothetical protein
MRQVGLLSLEKQTVSVYLTKNTSIQILRSLRAPEPGAEAPG